MAWHLNRQRVEIIGRHWLIGEASSSASAATPRASFSDRGIRRAFGVLVGVFLSQVFTIAHESRARRLDALVGLVAASGRMIGAYERLLELFEGGRYVAASG